MKLILSYFGFHFHPGIVFKPQLLRLIWQWKTRSHLGPMYVIDMYRSLTPAFPQCITFRISGCDIFICTFISLIFFYSGQVVFKFLSLNSFCEGNLQYIIGHICQESFLAIFKIMIEEIHHTGLCVMTRVEHIRLVFIFCITFLLPCKWLKYLQYIQEV